MKVTTLITLPDEVYQFYSKTASQRGDCTTEQVIVDTLICFASPSASRDSNQQISSASKSLNG